jgi:hypothetical protein
VGRLHVRPPTPRVASISTFFRSRRETAYASVWETARALSRAAKAEDLDPTRSRAVAETMRPSDYPDGVRGAALAHKYESETTAAYQRGQKLEKRRALMRDWAQFWVGQKVIRFREVG